MTDPDGSAPDPPERLPGQGPAGVQDDLPALLDREDEELDDILGGAASVGDRAQHDAARRGEAGIGEGAD